MDTKWIKEKFDEITSTLEKMETKSIGICMFRYLAVEKFEYFEMIYFQKQNGI